MMVLIPFTFKYLVQGQMQELVLPVVEGWLPVKPIVDAMGMKWETQVIVLRKHPSTQQIKIPGFRGMPPLCMTLQSIPDWLKSINTSRVKNPDVVKHFQTALPIAIESYLDSLKPKPVVEDVKPDIETEIWDEQRALDHLKHTVVIEHELVGGDHFRSDLVAVGVRDSSELSYLCNNVGVVVFKLDPDNPDGSPLTRTVLFNSYEKGDLLTLARNGFFPAPEFFRRYPEKYQQKVVMTRKFERTLDGSVKSSSVGFEPEGGAPWYSDVFAAKIANRLELLRKFKDKKLSQELQDLVESGVNIFDSVWLEVKFYEF